MYTLTTERFKKITQQEYIVLDQTHGGPTRSHDRKMPVEFLSLNPVYRVTVLCEIHLSEHMSHQ